MMSARTSTARRWDDRGNGAPVAVVAFGGLLCLVITAHTVLETARDTLLLAGPGPRALGIIYIAIALCTYPASVVASRASERFGTRPSLAGVLALAAVIAASVFFLPGARTSAILVYVASGVIASVVVPAFWTFAGSMLTVAEGRELFGTIAAAGVFGGVAGSAVATAALTVTGPRTLLLISAAIFLAARALLVRIPPRRERPGRRTGRIARGSTIVPDERSFLVRVALIMFLSTCALLALDYLFKSAVNQSVPPRDVGRFVARFYLTLNSLSLVVQLFLSRLIIARLGVALAVVITPLLLFGGASAAAVSGGVFAAVLVLKLIDGALRYSLHRIAAELVYLPLPLSVRERAKPLIDGAIGRTAQTMVGAGFLAFEGPGPIRLRPLAAAVTILVLAWLLVALTLRRPYLSLLRRAISRYDGVIPERVGPIDRETAELLVSRLGAPDPQDVIGAMSVLARRGGADRVPALILLHPDEAVLRKALEILSSSRRSDWIGVAVRLLADPREAVRLAAARSLATRGSTAGERLATDPSERIRGYAAIRFAPRDGEGDVSGPGVGSLADVASGSPAELGMLMAISDSAPAPRLRTLVRALGDRPCTSGERTELLARAIAAQRELAAVPRLISLLAARSGRAYVRQALVALGDPAFDAVWSALRDPARPFALRVHLPRTLARFENQRAADCLLETVKSEQDGSVRHKALLALASVARSGHARVDRRTAEHLCVEELGEYFRLLALRSKIETAAGTPEPRVDDGDAHRATTERLLEGLLDDDARQCLDRVFLLLEIAHPHGDVRRASLAFTSEDDEARAIASEFLDAKLRRRGQRELRSMLRGLFADRPGSEAARRSAARRTARERALDRVEALQALCVSRDPLVAEFARRCTAPEGAGVSTPASSTMAQAAVVPERGVEGEEASGA
jgi:AAA family ATP:ADP antiporter